MSTKNGMLRENTFAFAMLAVILIAFSGCKQDPIRAKMIGTWRIEHGEKLTKRVNQEEELSSQEIDDISERMTMTFYSSGALTTKTQMGQVNREKNGSWEVVKYDDENSTLEIRCNLMGQETDHEVRFIENDLIRLVPPNMAGTKSKMSFRRK
jgi:hypothetical protein